MIDHASLNERHENVPSDYYDVGIRRNLFQRYWHRRRFHVIRSLLGERPVDRLLDLGCHGGYLTAYLKQITNAGAVRAYDLSPDAIAYARRAHPGIDFVVVDLHLGLPDATGTYDVVTAFDVLEHLVDPPSLVREVRRVLHPRGRFIIAVPNESRLFKVIWWWWTTFARGKVWDETHLHEFTPASLVDIVDGAGFRKITERRIHLGMYWMVLYERVP